MVKRGQVTLFIIIGIVILVLIGIYISFLGERTPSFETGYEDFSSMRVFVESGLKHYSEDAIIKIGEHGGYIYSIDFLAGDYKKEYGQIETAVGIESIYMRSDRPYGISLDGGYRFASPVPDYPWSGFSRDRQDHFSEESKLGRPIIPPLEITTARSATTIKREMEEYIEEGIQSLNVEENFENEFDVKVEGEPNATVIFGGRKTQVELEYPINMTHKGTRDYQKMDGYQIELPIDFRTLYTFIEEALYYETSDFKSDINDPTFYEQLPSNKDEFRISIIDLEDEFDLITFIYNQTHGDEYRFRTIRQNRIPAMYELTPKTYTVEFGGEEEEVEYDLDLIDLNNHTNEDTTEGFESFDGSILDYIREPEMVQEAEGQAIDPDELDELTFTYGKSDDCPEYDEVTFSVTEDSGDFSIGYPDHHINLVNYTCETRVFVSDQADAPVKDYESVYFQHTPRECLNHECGICKECCWEGCCMTELNAPNQCCDPEDSNCPCNYDALDNAREKNDPYDDVPDEDSYGDSEYSIDVDPLEDDWPDYFMEEGDVLQGSEEKGNPIYNETLVSEAEDDLDECEDDCQNDLDDCENDCQEDYDDCMDDAETSEEEDECEEDYAVSECEDDCEDNFDDCEDDCDDDFESDKQDAILRHEKCCTYCTDPCGGSCPSY